MIQQLIDDYLARGGKRPYALLFPVGVYSDIPADTFVVWTPLVTGRVIITSLLAASTLLHESMQMIVKEPEMAEGKVEDA